MDAQQLIRLSVLNSLKNCETPEGFVWPEEIAEHNVDRVWEEYSDACDDWLCDALSEFRGSWTEETKIPCESSRHYESKSVAVQIGDRWVGWTYWYGGGKYGRAHAIDWVEDAYFLECREEMRPIRVFSRT